MAFTGVANELGTQLANSMQVFATFNLRIFHVILLTFNHASLKQLIYFCRFTFSATWYPPFSTLINQAIEYTFKFS